MGYSGSRVGAASCTPTNGTRRDTNDTVAVLSTKTRDEMTIGEHIHRVIRRILYSGLSALILPSFAVRTHRGLLKTAQYVSHRIRRENRLSYSSLVELVLIIFYLFVSHLILIFK